MTVRFPDTGEHRAVSIPKPPPYSGAMVLLELYDAVGDGPVVTAHAVAKLLWDDHPPLRAELFAVLARTYRHHAGAEPTAVRVTGAW